VDRWLDFLEEEHGGIDSVLLWPTYTNIGADDRNQFELVESLPVEYW
jgi:iron(II)-dependent oxidoreductase